MGTLKVIQPGLLSTIQDLGRWGFGKIGMPVAGAMDDYAARIANLLLCNDEHEPVLEVTYIGPALTFETATQFVITGGDLQPRLNDQPCALWTIQQANAGDSLSFAGMRTGCRAYLAVAGGFQVTPVMGSASTYLRGKLGGHDGRALQTGDRLEIADEASSAALVGWRLPEEFLPPERDSIRVILGPQDDAFTPEGIQTLLSAAYRISNEADRMGYRLEGPTIEHVHSADIISDGIALGAIQVPAHGTPIIMLADRQTTGGYTKIANVISVDIPLVAQKKPGDTLRFEAISIEEAQALYRQRHQRFQQIRELVQAQLDQASREGAHYRLYINDQVFQVSIQPVIMKTGR